MIIFLNGKFDPHVDGIQLGIAVMLLVLGILVAVACAKKLLDRDPVSGETPQDKGIAGTC